MTKVSAVRVTEPERPSRILTKRVFCDLGMPSDWRARPATIVSDFGWIVGKPRRSTTPSRAPTSLGRQSTSPFLRMQAANSPLTGMP
jgi:hypothetical protein